MKCMVKWRQISTEGLPRMSPKPGSLNYEFQLLQDGITKVIIPWLKKDRTEATLL